MYDLAVQPQAAPEPDTREVILRADKVGKAFHRFEQQPFLLRNLLGRLVGKKVEPKLFWPLRDVSFEIRRGEAVAIIGHNGAGKSTLLRIIAGACFPTVGKLSVRGRIAPLLSLGTGFQPDMTGRECIEINATTLGLTKEEIHERLDSIVAFAEIGDFIDTPMRFYSSGMGARLGFAVAVHTSPDLLLLDEVLSVGDHSFQKKCLARIEEMRRAGVTLLYVSHSGASVRKMCDRVIWLKDGHVVADGPPGPIVDQYEAT
jgi:ABC-type polysaccharide/polyol phosphate transport system ATPase subunit